MEEIEKKKELDMLRFKHEEVDFEVICDSYQKYLQYP